MNDIVSKRARDWALLTLLVSLPSWFATSFDSAIDDNPIFMPIDRVMPIEIWGWFWGLSTVCAIATWRWRRWWTYAVAMVAAFVSSIVYTASVVWAKFVDDARVSVTAIGLFVFTSAVLVRLLLIPSIEGGKHEGRNPRSR